MSCIPTRIKKLKKEGMVECDKCYGYGSIKRVKLLGDIIIRCRKCKGQGFLSWVDDLKGEVDDKQHR